MSKFQVGDKVKIPKTKSYYKEGFEYFLQKCHEYRANYCTIKSVGNDDKYFLYILDNVDNPKNLFLECDLELYEEFKEKITHKYFEIGDEIYVIEDCGRILNDFFPISSFSSDTRDGIFIRCNLPHYNNRAIFDKEIDYKKSWERKQEKLHNPLSFVGGSFTGELKQQEIDIKDYENENGNPLTEIKEGQIIFKKTNIKNMNLREKIQFALTAEPLKTLIENDVRNSDGSLTSQGNMMFNDFLQAKFRTEFDEKTIADIKALEEKENKKAKK